MKASEIMTIDPATCRLETPLGEVARMMVEHDCGMIPVVNEQGSPVGTVTDRDIACRTVATDRSPLELRARDVMTTPCVTVAPETPIDQCARVLEERKVRRVVVADGDGGCRGVVSQADVATRGPTEIVAEIVSEVSRPGRAASQV